MSRIAQPPRQLFADGGEPDLRPLFQGLLDGDQNVCLHFQPIVALDRGTVTGYEALCRFPEAFHASPDVCFAQARRLGLGRALEDLVFRRALAHRSQLPPNCFLSVNIGPDYLLSQELQASLEQEADLAGIVLEVTEEASIEDYPAARSRLARVRQQGGFIAVDDAGSGYASLNHILEIKPEFIKIDRRIIQNCHLDRAKSTLIEMLGAAANRMDAWILAEGVEYPGELDELLTLGVPLAQGYLFARPAPTMSGVQQTAVEAILARRQEGDQQGTLHGLFTPLTGHVDRASAEAAMRHSLPGGVAVITDEWNRPTVVLQQRAPYGIEELRPFLRVQVASHPHEVLQRAVYRSLDCRFHPVIVITPEGELLGVVNVDHLLHSVLGSPFPNQSAGRTKARIPA